MVKVNMITNKETCKTPSISIDNLEHTLVKPINYGSNETDNYIKQSYCRTDRVLQLSWVKPTADNTYRVVLNIQPLIKYIKLEQTKLARKFNYLGHWCI